MTKMSQVPEVGGDDSGLEALRAEAQRNADGLLSTVDELVQRVIEGSHLEIEKVPEKTISSPDLEAITSLDTICNELEEILDQLIEQYSNLGDQTIENPDLAIYNTNPIIQSVLQNVHTTSQQVDAAIGNHKEKLQQAIKAIKSELIKYHIDIINAYLALPDATIQQIRDPYYLDTDSMILYHTRIKYHIRQIHELTYIDDLDETQGIPQEERLILPGAAQQQIIDPHEHLVAIIETMITRHDHFSDSPSLDQIEQSLYDDNDLRKMASENIGSLRELFSNRDDQRNATTEPPAGDTPLISIIDIFAPNQLLSDEQINKQLLDIRIALWDIWNETRYKKPSIWLGDDYQAIYNTWAKNSGKIVNMILELEKGLRNNDTPTWIHWNEIFQFTHAKGFYDSSTTVQEQYAYMHYLIQRLNRLKLQ